jgi:hypothetical protein
MSGWSPNLIIRRKNLLLEGIRSLEPDAALTDGLALMRIYPSPWLLPAEDEVPLRQTTGRGFL